MINTELEPIMELPIGTRVRLLKLEPNDGYAKWELEGRTFVMSSSESFKRVLLLDGVIDDEYVFINGATYEILNND